MTELEKVEKLREKADVTYAEAKEALEFAGGDILDALLYLENQGKATTPAGGGYFSGAGTHQSQEQQYYRNYDGNAEHKGETFAEMLKRFGRFCLKILNKGNTTFIDATKNDELMFTCPVTAAVILLVFFFWVIVPLFILSLFFSFHYNFRGEGQVRNTLNSVMDGASNVVDDLKRSFSGNTNNVE